MRAPRTGATGAGPLTLAGLGIEVSQGVLPFDLAPIVEFWPLLGQVGVAYLLAQRTGGERLVGERMRAMAEDGRRVSAARYLAGIEAVDAFRRSVTDAFAGIDLIMTPSAAALPWPWPADQPYPESIDGKGVGPRGHAVYTGWVNACGHLGIALPCQPSGAGLSIGFQLVGRFGADELLFEIARRYESACPWAERWPRIVNAA